MGIPKKKRRNLYSFYNANPSGKEHFTAFLENANNIIHIRCSQVTTMRMVNITRQLKEVICALLKLPIPTPNNDFTNKILHAETYAKAVDLRQQFIIHKENIRHNESPDSVEHKLKTCAEKIVESSHAILTTLTPPKIINKP